MKLIAIFTFLTLLYTVCGHTLIDEEWESFKLHFNKRYNVTEDGNRKAIWEEKKRLIDYHNREAGKGIHTYYLGINSFSDKKHSEVMETMHGLKLSKDRIYGKEFIPSVSVDVLPDQVNWTAEGYVTEVGSQGTCGSCWAFSVLGALEGQWFKKTKQLVRLSVQDLMDCSTKIGNQGCYGGYMDKTYQYIKTNKGVDTWASYPYEAKNGKCRFNSKDVGATDNGFVDIKKGSESDLQVAVATIGPIAVAVDGEQASFGMYKSGVYDEPKCSSKAVDHTLLVVGYGTYNGKDYWLAKNSWGTSWGMNGYIMMSRNKNNQCGIATMANYPTL